MSVLVIAESNGKEVDRGTLSAITAAQKISNEISLLILEAVSYTHLRAHET